MTMWLLSVIPWWVYAIFAITVAGTVSYIFQQWKLWLILGVIVAALIAVLYFHTRWYDQGRTAEIQTMEKANAEEDARATAGAEAVDLCYKSGGDWDRADGVCTHAASK
jgi:hypothetical protein